jgi:hypothetical protein
MPSGKPVRRQCCVDSGERSPEIATSRRTLRTVVVASTASDVDGRARSASTTGVLDVLAGVSKIATKVPAGSAIATRLACGVPVNGSALPMSSIAIAAPGAKPLPTTANFAPP